MAGLCAASAFKVEDMLVARGKPDGGQGDEGGEVSARFSKSLARRRFRPHREKVRSTAPRRRKTTKPLVSSLRFAISKRSGVSFASAAPTCHGFHIAACHHGESR
jgi:hypothetical protein